MSIPSSRPTLRDLPLPAKLVVTTFLISVGIGYLWALAQIHFKHASPGNPMPTAEDIVTKFSGVPWPIEPKPEKPADGAPVAKLPDGEKVPGVKIKTILSTRCARCHKAGEDKADKPLDTYAGLSKYLQKNQQFPETRLHAVVLGITSRGDKRTFNSKDMSDAFTKQTDDWDDMSKEQRLAEKPKREAEQLALLAWIDAGAPEACYEADAFPLGADERFKNLPASLRTMAVAASSTGKKPVDKWKDAKAHQISVEALTQSTHAHLLTFSVLWAATGIIFAFSGYSCTLRCLLSPIVLVAQIADIACWWLARLDGVGPYFALAIMGTGAVVGLGISAQIVLSLMSMYGRKGRLTLALLFLIGAGAFGLTYVKVIKPQLDAEKHCVDQESN